MMMESAGELLLSAPPLQLASATATDNGGPSPSFSSQTALLPAAASSFFSPSPNSSDNMEEAAQNNAQHRSEEEEEKQLKGQLMDEENVGLIVGRMVSATAQILNAQPSTANGQNDARQPLALTKPPGDEREERPSHSYKDLIIEAIESSPERRLKLSEIYQVIKYLHPYYQRRADQWGWQNSIRHNLSLHDCFVKLPLKQTSANGVVGHFWTVVHRNPEDKPGPTRRRSRANATNNGIGKGRKGGSGGGQQGEQRLEGGGKAKGLKGRQSVSSDSGVMSDDGGASSQSGNISPTAAGGGSASVPAMLQIPHSNEPLGKFQTPLLSPLALSSHQPPPSSSSAMHFLPPLPTTPTIPHQQQQAQSFFSPLELVLNGQLQQQQHHSLAECPQQPQPNQLFQFSPIPGKTAQAPAQPQASSLLEQQLQQLWTMAASNNNIGGGGPPTPQPATPASAPPTMLSVAATPDAGLTLLSQLASQALTAVQPQQQPQQSPLAMAAAAAAAELQRLQLLQLYAQQQQQQLQQQLALLEQSQRDHPLAHLGVHSAPLSPTVAHEQHPSAAARDQQQSAILTQLLLARLLNTHDQAIQHHSPTLHQQPPKTSPPPPTSAQTQLLGSPTTTAGTLFAAQQQLELAQAALLLEQYQQQQQQHNQSEQLAMLEQHIQLEQQRRRQLEAAAINGGQLRHTSLGPPMPSAVDQQFENGANASSMESEVAVV